MSPWERALRLAHELSGTDMKLDTYRSVAQDPCHLGQGVRRLVDVCERHILEDRLNVAAGRDAIDAAVRSTGMKLEGGAS